MFSLIIIKVPVILPQSAIQAWPDLSRCLTCKCWFELENSSLWAHMHLIKTIMSTRINNFLVDVVFVRITNCNHSCCRGVVGTKISFCLYCSPKRCIYSWPFQLFFVSVQRLVWPVNTILYYYTYTISIIMCQSVTVIQ